MRIDKLTICFSEGAWPFNHSESDQENRMKGFKGMVSLLVVVAFSVTAVIGQSSHFDISGMDTNTVAALISINTLTAAGGEP